MIEKLKLPEVRLKLVLFVFFVFLFLLSIPYPAKSKQFPQLIALFSLIMILISLVTDFAKKGAVAKEITDVDDTELKVIDETATRLRRKRFYRAWEIILVSTAAGFLGGFLFSSFFYFIGFAIFFGERKNLIKNLVIAGLMTLIMYLLFQWIMKVPLLTGILWEF